MDQKDQIFNHSYIYKQKKLFKAIEKNTFLIRVCLKCLLNSPVRSRFLKNTTQTTTNVYSLTFLLKRQDIAFFIKKKKVDPLNITQPAQNIFTSNLFKACFKFQNKQLLPQHSYILSAILNHA